MIAKSQRTSANEAAHPPNVRLLRVAGFLAAVLGLTAIAHFVHARELNASGFTLSIAAELLLFGKLLFVAAALGYALHACFDSKLAGQWARALAFAGVIETVVGLSLQWLSPLEPVHAGTWLLVIAMLIYLRMEAAYATRSAGVVVVPVLAAVALLQPPLLHLGQQIGWDGVARAYCHYACVAATVVGYALLAMGAVLGAARLVLAQRRARRAAVGALSRRKTERWLLQANIIGFVVLVVATLLWEIVVKRSIGSEFTSNPIEPWVLIVLFVYAGHLLLHFITHSPGVRTAFWALTNFSATLLGLGLVMLQ